MTYQEAAADRDDFAKRFPEAVYEVREVPLGDAVEETATPAAPKKPYSPPKLEPLPRAAAGASGPLNFGLDPVGYLCAASPEALAKAYFFSDRSILRHVCEMADFGSGSSDVEPPVGPFEAPLAPKVLETLERAWTLGKAAPDDSFTIEALMYRGAMKTAKDIFLLAVGFKVVDKKQI